MKDTLHQAQINVLTIAISDLQIKNKKLEVRIRIVERKTKALIKAANKRALSQ